MTDMSTIGARCRVYRHLAGLSQREAGEKAGVDETTIWRIEANRVQPTVETLTTIAEALGVPVGALLGTETYIPKGLR